MSGKVFIIGHSHTTALIEGARACGLEVDSCNLWFSKAQARADDSRQGLRADLVRRIGRADTVISALGGGAYLVFGILASERPFDVLCGDACLGDMDAGAELVPTAGVRAAIAAAEAGPLRLLPEIAAHTRGRLLHLLPPPCTSRWDEAAYHRLTQRMAQLQRAGTPLMPRVTSRLLRLWTLMADEHRRIAGSSGIECMGPPPDTLETAGWLEQHFSSDHAHGNARYGMRALSRAGIVNTPSETESRVHLLEARPQAGR